MTVSLMEDSIGDHFKEARIWRSNVCFADVMEYLLPYDLYNKFRHKIKLKAIIEVFKPSKEMQDEILRKPTAISALFLISSANSVLVSVILFGAAILSCIFRFPDLTQSTVGKLPFRVAGVFPKLPLFLCMTTLGLRAEVLSCMAFGELRSPSRG